MVEGRILLVDDETGVLRATRRILEALGYEVQSFDVPSNAIEYFEHSAAEVDLVLMDMNMPQMSGIDLFRRLKERQPDVCALLFSGAPDEAHEAALAEGFRGVVGKPVDVKELSERLVAARPGSPASEVG